MRNLNAILDDEELRITATVKNSGQTSITALFIDSITVSAISIEQDKYGILTLDDSTNTDTDYCKTAKVAAAGTPPVIACTAAEDARGFSISTTGWQSGDTVTVSPSTLEGGRNKRACHGN